MQQPTDLGARNAHRERGATMVIVVVAMTAMMGAAAFAIDLGAAWALRRDMITGTDAAALAVAADLAVGNNTCGTVDVTYMAANAPAATVLSCTPQSGYVEVTAGQESPSYFGRVLGLADIDVPSYSAAKWGSVDAATGLRPFGICAGTILGPNDPPWLTQVRAYLANPSSTVIEIVYGKDEQTDPCRDPNANNGSGNWGVVDLDDPLVCAPAFDPTHPCNGNSNNTPDIRDWTADGFDRPIQAGPAGTCGSDPEHCWGGNPGASMNSGQVKNALNGLIANNTWFTLPVFDWAEGGNGNNTQYHISELVRVRLIDYCFGGGCSPMTAPPAGCTPTSQCNWFIRLEFAPGLVTGTCCAPSTQNEGALVTALCAVIPGETGGC